MRKIFCVILGLVLVETPCFAQAPKQTIKTIVNKAAKVAKKTSAKAAAKNAVNNVSSKQLKAILKTDLYSSKAAYNIHQQEVMGIMLNKELEQAQKMALLKAHNEQNALILKEWTETVTADRMRWAAALVRERNPKFLPPKNKDIPDLIAVSPREDAPDLTPAYFREWARLIPLYSSTPEQYQGLIVGLRQQLIKLDIQYRMLEERVFKSEKILKQAGKPLPQYYYISQIDKLSREAAQCITDLVFLLNLYPAVYNQSLALLAAKLDALPYTTPFLKYIRPQILIPNTVKAGAEENSANPSSHKVVRGFSNYQEESSPSTFSKKPESPVQNHRVVKGFSVEEEK